MNAPTEFTTFLPMTPAIRQRLEATIDNLIALLDEIDGDADRESSGDDEPVLGWPDEWTGRGASMLHITGDDDRELEGEHDEDGGDAEPDHDGESSLGWTITGSMGGTDDRVEEHDGSELSLDAGHWRFCQSGVVAFDGEVSELLP